MNSRSDHHTRNAILWMLSGFILLAINVGLSYAIYSVATRIAWHDKMIADSPDPGGARLVLVLALLGWLRGLVEPVAIILIPVGLIIGIRKIIKLKY